MSICVLGQEVQFGPENKAKSKQCRCLLAVLVKGVANGTNFALREAGKDVCRSILKR